MVDIFLKYLYCGRNNAIEGDSVDQMVEYPLYQSRETSGACVSTKKAIIVTIIAFQIIAMSFMSPFSHAEQTITSTNAPFIIKNIYTGRSFGPHYLSTEPSGTLEDQVGFSVVQSETEPTEFFVKYFERGLGKKLGPYEFSHAKWLKVQGKTFKLITSEEGMAKALAREQEIIDEENMRRGGPQQADDGGQQEDETKLTPEQQKTYDLAYSRCMNNFQSLIGIHIELSLLNGTDVIGKLVKVTSDSVVVAKDKVTITVYRDKLNLGSWLQCNAEDYAKYHASIAAECAQEEYIQEMINRQEQKEAEELQRAIEKEKEDSAYYYETVKVKIKCAACGGKGYKAGFRNYKGEVSKRQCISCRGKGSHLQTKRVRRER